MIKFNNSWFTAAIDKEIFEGYCNGKYSAESACRQFEISNSLPIDSLTVHDLIDQCCRIGYKKRSED